MVSGGVNGRVGTVIADFYCSFEHF